MLRGHLGDVFRAGDFGVRRIDYPPGLRQPHHTHEHGSITILLAGEIRESTETGEETGTAMSVVVKASGVRHADEVGPRGARTVQVAFDPRHLTSLGDSGSDLDQWQWIHGGPQAAPLLDIARAVLAGPLPPPGLEDLALEAAAAITAPAARCPAPPGWLARVKAALSESAPTSPSVAELAGLAGVHPVSVSRAFRREYGMTITEYRRRQRWRRAADMITGTGHSLSRIAYAAGYADHAHMCREFRHRSRFSPSELRQLTGTH